MRATLPCPQDSNPPVPCLPDEGRESPGDNFKPFPGNSIIRTPIGSAPGSEILCDRLSQRFMRMIKIAGEGSNAARNNGSALSVPARRFLYLLRSSESRRRRAARADWNGPFRYLTHFTKQPKSSFSAISPLKQANSSPFRI